MKRQALLFGLIAVFGLVIDFGMTLLLQRGFGVALALSSGVGFLCATVFNYVLNVLFTFADRKVGFSASGYFRYLATVSAGLVVRLAVIVGLGYLFGTQPPRDLVILVVAVGVSFIANFMLARKFAFV